MEHPNDGFVNWQQADVVWTGAAFQLELLTTVPAGATNWLNVNLGDRLTTALGTPVVAVVTPAQHAVSGPEEIRRGYEELGLIVVGPLPEPLPDAKVVYNVIGDAVTEAYEQTKRAGAVGSDYQEQLRKLGRQSPPK